MRINTYIRFILAGIACTISFVDAQDCGDAQEWEDTMNSQPGYALTAWIDGGIVLKDAEQMGDDGDIFAAFDESCNVRGIATLQISPAGPYQGTTVYAMTMGSNTVGDILNFKYYEESSDMIYDIAETYEFVISDQIGNLIDPVFYNIELAFVTLSFSNPTTSSINIEYDSNVGIGGFQFNVEGVTLTNASGGDAEENGLLIQSENNTVLSFSLTGTTIPAGSGTLISLEFEGSSDATVEVSNIIISDANGSAISNNSPILFPLLFRFNQSVQQAFYFFLSVTINGNAVASDDWVGAYRDTDGDEIGDLCVGSRQWDTSKCGGGICDLPIMGDDGNSDTDGYMIFGNIPSFQIYDASENKYYIAEPSENFPWYDMALNTLDLLSTNQIISGCTDDGSLPDSPFPGIEACNYDYYVTEEEDSCDYTCIGCLVAEACNYDSDYTVDCGDDCCVYPQENKDCDGNCIVEIDCSGECGGEAEVDDCGICNGDNSPNTGTCDCNGDPGGTAFMDVSGYFNDECFDEAICVGGNTGLTACLPDCFGIFAGSAVEDNCGHCHPGNEVQENGTHDDCLDDCAGTPGGSEVDDECEVCHDPVCVGGALPAGWDYNPCPDGEYLTNQAWNTSCLDCNGVINGSAYIDPYCGDGELCVGGNTPLTACIQDCTGIWGGGSVMDDCDICGGDDSSCTDCNGVIDGVAYLDGCNECVGGNTGKEACPTDCEGVLGGTSFYDNCGTCDSDSSNDCVPDCAGTWGGDLVDDECGICDGDNSVCLDCNGVINGTAYYDPNCGNSAICVGGNTTLTACTKDCAGIWGGSDYEDNCGVCANPENPPEDWPCPKDCSGIYENTYKDDECGICRLPVCVGGALPAGWNNNNNPCPEGEYPTNQAWNTSCLDCNGVINGSAYIDPYCGDGELCVGGNTPLTACTQDCAGIWGGSAVEDECGVCGGNGPEDNYNCDGNCIAVLDCEYTCGGTVIPNIECPDKSIVCALNDCVLDIQPHLLPDKFGINKIFPNPFNPVTQVQYDISAYAFVKIRIFDIRGRQVTQLMNQYQSPGQYHLTWDAGNHASGMYIVEMVIRSGDDAAIFRDIRKILYLK